MCCFNEYSQRIARPVFAYNKCPQVAAANVEDLSRKNLLFDKRDVKRDTFRQETEERCLEVKSLATKTPKVVWKVIDFIL